FLELKPVEIDALHALLLREPARLLLLNERFPGVVERLKGFHRVFESGKAVEQVHLNRRLQNILVFVLAVDIDEKRAQLLQRAQRDGTIVQKRFRASIGKAFATNDDLIRLFKTMIVPPALERAMFGDFENAVDVAAIRALAHRLRTEPVAG